ncbi:OLC1v1007116C1 [Oldenlandia corymbosa var. corymbosa]|uniref:OLC1v1007116C1 n=1 Tax=Oldenlandia corymbosa var. corymbosa TaxID=529605 RepID=A0AAV1DIJ4_OLDCO|nr:OLC1v1007116C1 [Oldenlandia corymbosa var. corymbosa]
MNNWGLRIDSRWILNPKIIHPNRKLTLSITELGQFVNGDKTSASQRLKAIEVAVATAAGIKGKNKRRDARYKAENLAENRISSNSNEEEEGEELHTEDGGDRHWSPVLLSKN